VLVKNTTNKPIGFGSVILLPDSISKLPEGFGPDHPTVKFFLGKKWLVEVDENAPKDDASNPSSITPERLTPEQSTPEQTAAKAAEDVAAKIKALDRMNLEALRNEANTLGVAWAESDTKAMIAQKITEKLQAAGV